MSSEVGVVGNQVPVPVLQFGCMIQKFIFDSETEQGKAVYFGSKEHTFVIPADESEWPDFVKRVKLLNEISLTRDIPVEKIGEKEVAISASH